ncbi:uroporphyrinogen-III C-methyltransferase [Microbulbifer celer]|uniref:Uroporphyrinogen-III C-methyltransferase n=1 Tax=Microbulbifer celer TaxID=435905 RepID=A0ABW3U4T8_9GAMM|nr:uroporphyrinogen-III C-methyltransferase [Microbulbifer celer]UFN56827.1 uroporphyrinogen-III C-methyltransferase [Microbulbifer celer]
MSDKKTPTPGSQSKPEKQVPPTKDVPLVTEKVEPDQAAGEKAGSKSNFAKADQARGKDSNGDKGGNGGGKQGKAAKAPRKGHGWLWFWLFILLLIAAAVAAWYFLPAVRQQVDPHLREVPVVGKFFDSHTALAGDTSRNNASAADTADTRVTDRQSSSDTATPTADSGSDTTRSAESGTDTSGNDRETGTDQNTDQRTAQPDQSARQASPPTQQPGATSPTPPPAVDHTKELRQQLEQQAQTIARLQQQLAGLQRNVTAQGNRLSQLGNASREDWQLAEADYLLRLAGQRLKLEQNSRAALGLVQEVDKILRNLDLPDLYGVRQQLAGDLTALKLVENVDREGLYLRLRALEEQMVKLNIQPQFDLAKQADIAAGENAAPGKDNVESSWNNFVNFLKGSIRIRDAEVDPVLLSPQSESRFRQGLQLSMEQAELALLRADETVYQDALQRATKLLQEYGVDNRQRQVILKELQELSGVTVATELPDLSASQTALRNYIDRMHKMSSGQDDSSSRIPGGSQ